MSISKLNFEVMFYTHRSMRIRKQIVIWNFYLRVMVVSLGLISKDRIRKQSASTAFYRSYRRNQRTGEISLERSRCQIFRSSIRSSNQRMFAFTTNLEMNLLWLRKWYPIGVKFVFMDRGHVVLHYDWRDRKVNELRSSSVIAVKVHSMFPQVSSEPVAKRCLGKRRYFDCAGRGSETSGLAMLLVRACGAETFVSWILLERAGASCVFMLELNFHSVSFIYSNETDEHE
ncbi:hypothetical protein F2Q69_00014911 [Brassica cretica]|uniref:Uncharacterized protein n=1 Tax=Brassica cretica TaxID=69181 RepID=A0A8S9R9X4_BRACR|nr:hypothetical protein F2Q69_00014911 [Brassica cretica]